MSPDHLREGVGGSTSREFDFCLFWLQGCPKSLSSSCYVSDTMWVLLLLVFGPNLWRMTWRKERRKAGDQSQSPGPTTPAFTQRAFIEMYSLI